MLLRNLKFRIIVVAILCLSLAGFCYYRFYTAEGVLAQYGVHFNPDAVNYESYNLNTVRIWFDGPKGRLTGPDVTGDLLVVEMPRRSKDGRLEFAVKTSVYKQNNRVWIQLLSPPNGDQAFHVVLPEHTMLRVRYPFQKDLPQSP